MNRRFRRVDSNNYPKQTPQQMEPRIRWWSDISGRSFGFDAIWKVGAETLNHYKTVVWFGLVLSNSPKVETFGVQFWNNMLAEPKEANTRQELVPFCETALRMYSTSARDSQHSVFTPGCRVMHQAKRVTSADFISHRRETERVESSLTIPVTLSLYSTTHSCPW